MDIINVPSKWVVGSLTVLTGLLLVKRYINGPVYSSSGNVKKKVAIVTGSNTGIGFETALGLAKRGAHVILACRDLDKGQEAMKQIFLKTNKNCSLEVLPLELASLSSIRSFIEEFKKKHETLDILVNNAATFGHPKLKSVDGFDFQLASNYIGHYYLTNLLIDELLRSGAGRVINLASEMPRHLYHLEIEDLNFEMHDYSPAASYSQSKIAMALFSYELHRRYHHLGLTSVTVNPGFVNTSIFDKFVQRSNIAFRTVCKLLWLVISFPMKSSYHGAQTSIYCAVHPQIESGKYYSELSVATPLPLADDPQVASHLWNKTHSLIHDLEEANVSNENS